MHPISGIFMYKNKNDNFNDRKKKFDGYKDDFSERENQNEKDIIFGRNSVQEAIKAGRPLDSVMVARGERSGSVPKILADAKNAGIPIKEVDRKKLDFLCGHANHQGVIAMGAVKAYSTVDDIFAKAEEKGEPPFIIVCDEIEDPHNLGAIIRTAEAAGAHGVIVPKRRSAPLSFAVAKTSAGAVEFMHVARVTNIPQTLDELKEQGYLTAAGGSNDLYQWDNGVLLSITSDPNADETEVYSLPVLRFNATKWRSPLGAYMFMGCKALWPAMGTWSEYTIDSQAIS